MYFNVSFSLAIIASKIQSLSFFFLSKSDWKHLDILLKLGLYDERTNYFYISTVQIYDTPHLVVRCVAIKERSCNTPCNECLLCYNQRTLPIRILRCVSSGNPFRTHLTMILRRVVFGDHTLLCHRIC